MKGNQNPTTGKAEAELTMREAMLPPKLREWRAKLSVKAKQEKHYCFYSLYWLVSHPVTLQAAWEQVRANGGAAGVDGVSIEQVEKEGVEAFLGKLEDELREKTYRTGAVRRVNIPKANGKTRPLGIPNLRDRVVQCAVMLVLQPIFEADFMECSHGFRPGRSAHDALKEIREQLRKGLCEVYDADLAAYFDSIPHEKLMKCVRMRVVDGSVLRLIEQWLKAPVKEENGRIRRPPEDKGTPQGGVISPLLANIYLHWFDHVFHGEEGPAKKAAAVLVRYADDFVVMARKIGREVREFIEEKLEGWLGLKLNREKTRVVNLNEPKAMLDFLGYRFRFDRDLRGRAHRYLNMVPSPEAIKRERKKLHEMTDKRSCFMPLPTLIEKLNRHLGGWANYFRIGYPREAFGQIDHFVGQRLTQHLRRRSQRGWRRPEGTSTYAYFKHHGLKRLL
jgi:RNA-directed DNA polymerase